MLDSNVITFMDPVQFTKIQKALSEPKRLEIIEHIREMNPGGGITCSCVLAQTEIAQSTFSHHISELADAGLVTGVKEGRTMLLSVNDPLVEEYLEELKRKILKKM